ncbi:MAG: hypothetical protein IT184_03460 [Acidobacteria bacterium]|nr:hypothetical protein [Acidobacteriota bacterium]
MKLLPPPGPERRRQIGALALTVLLLGAVLWWRWPSTDVPTSSPAVASKPAGAVAVPAVASRTRADARADALPAPLKLTELESAPERVDVGRNPFAFGLRPTPPPPRVDAVLPPPAAPATRLPAEPAGPPPIRLVLTGMLVLPGGGRTMVTLRDPDTGASFRAFEGDVLDGRYRIVSVGSRSVTLSYIDGTGRRTISLGGG